MTQIEVTFLGTTAGVPTHNRNHPAIYVNYKGREETVALFDCGEGTQRQIFAARLNFMRIDDIFITHWHADHFAGLLGLLFTMNMEDRQRPLKIYGPEADEWVPQITDLGYGKLRFPVKVRNVEHEGNQIETLMEGDEIIVQAIPVKHGVPAVAYAFVEKDRIKIDKEKARALGLPEKGLVFKKLKEEGAATWKGKRILLQDVSVVEKGKKIVYTGDTMPCMNVVKLAENADMLIHDSTFFEEEKEKEWKHAAFDEVLKVATRANAKQLVLTHISRRYQNLEEIEKKIAGLPNVRLARDLMKITI
ncbi:MAG: ribonuclease Z [Candidatus Aenigmatarchaeota archaeon]